MVFGYCGPIFVFRAQRESEGSSFVINFSGETGCADFSGILRALHGLWGMLHNLFLIVSFSAAFTPRRCLFTVFCSVKDFGIHSQRKSEGATKGIRDLRKTRMAVGKQEETGNPAQKIPQE